MGLINHTATLRLGFTHVLPLPSDGSLEEPGTAANRNNASWRTSLKTKVKQKKNCERLVHTRRTQICRNVCRTNGLGILCMGCRTGCDLDQKRNICKFVMLFWTYCSLVGHPGYFFERIIGGNKFIWAKYLECNYELCIRNSILVFTDKGNLIFVLALRSYFYVF